jgi:hypothetical protein
MHTGFFPTLLKQFAIRTADPLEGVFRRTAAIIVSVKGFKDETESSFGDLLSHPNASSGIHDEDSACVPLNEGSQRRQQPVKEAQEGGNHRLPGNCDSTSL